MAQSIRQANYSVLLLEMFVLIVGILLALAVDRWNQDRLDRIEIDLLANQRAEYEAAQAVVGYWRDLIQGATNALDRHVDFYYTTEEMNEDDMSVEFDFATLVADRNLGNKVFDAVDIHGDWLRLQRSIYEITRQIDARLQDSTGSN